MKYPKKIIFKLRKSYDYELPINLINTMFDERLGVFRATIEISKDLVDSGFDKEFAELITEER